MASKEERYKEYRPHEGSAVTFKGVLVGYVHHVKGPFCWVARAGREPDKFIWCFRDGLNALHDWPGKDISLEAPCPGKPAFKRAAA